jgi:glutamine amidotransferase
MQLLCKSSDEDGETKGFNFYKKKIININKINNNLKVPHIGFNRVLINSNSNSNLYKNVNQENNFYFVHSHCLVDEDVNFQSYTSNYFFNFISSFENENIFGTQFHPEKSQNDGLKILGNFYNL